LSGLAKKWRFPACFGMMRASPPAAHPAGVAVYIGRKGAGLYKVGDKVVYPHHGAGTVIKKEKREVLGEKREYLTIKILHNDMTVNVPSENAEKVGLRKVIGEDMVKVVVKALTGGGTQMPKNWNRRFKHNRDKMKTGDILELAEVVRNLSLRDREKGLSTGEKQMFVKAKKILASELMYAKEMDEEATAEWLDDVLAGANATNGTTAKKKPTSSGAKATEARTPAAPSKASSKKASAKKPAAKKATAGAR
jgi:CarD family transcriptional regulator, regulator of rRNA transcription